MTVLRVLFRAPAMAALALISAPFGSPLRAQRSGFETGDAKTSIFLQDAGALSFNVADTSIRFGYVRRVSDNPYVYGFEAFGKPTNGLADFFQKGKPATEAGAAFSFGKHHLFSKDIDAQTGTETLKDDWIIVQAGYRRSTFNNIPRSGINPGNRRRNFDGYTATASYNARLAAGGMGTGMLIGISGGIERRNNLDRLTPVTIETPVASAVTTSQVTTAKQVRNGYWGDYAEYVAVPVYTDFIWLPTRLKSRIAFDAFTRSDAGSADRSFSPGFGVFFTKENAPTKVIGGISAAYKNGNLRIALVAGFNF